MKLIITGMGRCGSSLMMQILAAGGYPCTGEYPAYEPGEFRNQFEHTRAGHASKVLDIDKFRIPKGEYKWIFLRRNHLQPAKSAIKFMRILAGVHAQPWQECLMVRSYKISENKIFDKLRSVGGELLIIDFEDLIKNSAVTIKKVSDFVGGLDIEKAATAIIERETDCLKGLLEFDLLEGVK